MTSLCCEKHFKNYEEEGMFGPRYRHKKGLRSSYARRGKPSRRFRANGAATKKRKEAAERNIKRNWRFRAQGAARVCNEARIDTKTGDPAASNAAENQFEGAKVPAGTVGHRKNGRAANSQRASTSKIERVSQIQEKLDRANRSLRTSGPRATCLQLLSFQNLCRELQTERGISAKEFDLRLRHQFQRDPLNSVAFYADPRAISREVWEAGLFGPERQEDQKLV